MIRASTKVGMAGLGHTRQEWVDQNKWKTKTAHRRDPHGFCTRRRSNFGAENLQGANGFLEPVFLLGPRAAQKNFQQPPHQEHDLLK